MKSIRIPVLVTAGENDLVLPSETDRIAAALPDAEKVIFPGEDHGSYIIGSEAMGRLLIRFLAGKGYR